MLAVGVCLMCSQEDETLELVHNLKSLFLLRYEDLYIQAEAPVALETIVE